MANALQQNGIPGSMLSISSFLTKKDTRPGRRIEIAILPTNAELPDHAAVEDLLRSTPK